MRKGCVNWSCGAGASAHDRDMAVPHIPHFSTVCCWHLGTSQQRWPTAAEALLQSLLVRESPRDLHLLGEKQKLGELAGAEGYTDSVHPLWRLYQGNSSFLWSLMVSKEGSKVSNPEQQQTAPGWRSSFYIGGYKMSHSWLISRGWSWMVRQNR